MEPITIIVPYDDDIAKREANGWRLTLIFSDPIKGVMAAMEHD